MKRARKLSANHFLNALMFSSNNQAETSLPDLTADLDQQFSVEISKEGLHKRFNAQAVEFVKALIAAQLSRKPIPQSEVFRHF